MVSNQQIVCLMPCRLLLQQTIMIKRYKLVDMNHWMLFPQRGKTATNGLVLFSAKARMGCISIMYWNCIGCRVSHPSRKPKWLSGAWLIDLVITSVDAYTRCVFLTWHWTQTCCQDLGSESVCAGQDHPTSAPSINDEWLLPLAATLHDRASIFFQTAFNFRQGSAHAC